MAGGAPHKRFANVTPLRQNKRRIRSSVAHSSKSDLSSWLRSLFSRSRDIGEGSAIALIHCGWVVCLHLYNCLSYTENNIASVTTSAFTTAAMMEIPNRAGNTWLYQLSHVHIRSSRPLVEPQ